MICEIFLWRIETYCFRNFFLFLILRLSSSVGVHVTYFIFEFIAMDILLEDSLDYKSKRALVRYVSVGSCFAVTGYMPLDWTYLKCLLRYFSSITLILPSSSLIFYPWSWNLFPFSIELILHLLIPNLFCMSLLKLSTHNKIIFRRFMVFAYIFRSSMYHKWLICVLICRDVHPFRCWIRKEDNRCRKRQNHGAINASPWNIPRRMLILPASIVYRCC